MGSHAHEIDLPHPGSNGTGPSPSSPLISRARKHSGSNDNVGGRAARPLGKNAPRSRNSRKRIDGGFYCFVVIVILWFAASISFVVILDKEIMHTLKPNVTAILQGKNRWRLANLPEYPIDHRHLEASRRPLSDQAISQCHKALWHTLETTTYVLPNNESFVITGDIKDLWLRDSAAQIHPLLLPNVVHGGKSLVQVDPSLERVVSGLILKTARFIRFDPYANAFKMRNDTKFSRQDRDVLGRHGYIATWNYELDSACYFMRMIYFFHQNFPHHPILRMREVKQAVMIMIDVWISEQRHEEDAYPTGELFDCKHCGRPYRYNPKELSRQGKGTRTSPGVGLTWSGFRPSDDACALGYLIPANMFVVVVLGYVEELAETVWIDEPLMKRARKLKEEVDDGIKTHGIVNTTKYGRIYAYEVDGLGKSNLMDDANVPSLLSIPYLGYKYDKEVWVNTKRFILSKDNPWYIEGRSAGVVYKGIGSPHTKWIPNSIWPMAMIMEGLISNNRTEKVMMVDKLLSASAGMGWMHESFSANNPKKFSREWFCWPDSLFAELVMSLTSECPNAKHGKYTIKEWQDESQEMIGNEFMKEGLRHRRPADAPTGRSNDRRVVEKSVGPPNDRQTAGGSQQATATAWTAP